MKSSRAPSSWGPPLQQSPHSAEVARPGVQLRPPGGALRAAHRAVPTGGAAQPPQHRPHSAPQRPLQTAPPLPARRRAAPALIAPPGGRPQQQLTALLAEALAGRVDGAVAALAAQQTLGTPVGRRPPLTAAPAQRTPTAGAAPLCAGGAQLIFGVPLGVPPLRWGRPTAATPRAAPAQPGPAAPGGPWGGRWPQAGGVETATAARTLQEGLVGPRSPCADMAGLAAPAAPTLRLPRAGRLPRSQAEGVERLAAHLAQHQLVVPFAGAQQADEGRRDGH